MYNDKINYPFTDNPQFEQEEAVSGKARTENTKGIPVAIEEIKPFVDVNTEKIGAAEAGTHKSSMNKKGFVYLAIVYGFFALVMISEFFGGNLLLPLLMVIFAAIIGKRLIKIQLMIKDIRVSAVMNENSKWRKRIISWQFILRTVCWTSSIFITVSFFLFFFSTGVFYKTFLLMDALIMLWLTKKFLSPFNKHLNEKAANLMGELIANFLNVFILFFTYMTYSLLYENQISGFEGGTLDPNIPLWVKENINHSCNFFEKALRLYVCLGKTFENAVSLESWINIAYRIFHILTMSFWPFLGVTLFYRFFLSGNKLFFVRFNNFRSNNNVGGESNEV